MTPAGAIGSLRQPAFAAPASATPAGCALDPACPKIRPRDQLQLGGPVTLAFLWLSPHLGNRSTQLDKPPWSGSTQHYRWHIHRPAWRPGVRL
jgi:hypothetical protein